MNPPVLLGAAAAALVVVPVGLLLLLGAGGSAIEPQGCTAPVSPSNSTTLDPTPSTNTFAACGADLPSGNTSQVVAFAAGQVGKSYVLGAAGPDAWDCSSLVQAAYAAASIFLPRTADEQYEYARAHGQVSAGPPQLSGLQPGDLLFSPGSDPVPADDGQPIGHVAMYAGDGVVVEAKGATWGVIATRYTMANYATVTFVGRFDAPRTAMAATSPASAASRSAFELETTYPPGSGAS